MTSRDFVYWLNGFFELRGERGDAISEAQSECIQKHIALVFAHEIDPSYGDKKEQDKMNKIHPLSHVDPFGPKIRC